MEELQRYSSKANLINTLYTLQVDRESRAREIIAKRIQPALKRVLYSSTFAQISTSKASVARNLAARRTDSVRLRSIDTAFYLD